jgi:hypothetical protein
MGFFSPKVELIFVRYNIKINMVGKLFILHNFIKYLYGKKEKEREKRYFSIIL